MYLHKNNIILKNNLLFCMQKYIMYFLNIKHTIIFIIHCKCNHIVFKYYFLLNHLHFNK